MSKKSNEYRRAIRGAVRGLWKGIFDYDQFFDAMDSAVRISIPEAWYEGAKECGVLRDELSSKEKIELEKAIAYELQWIDGFAEAIETNREQGGRLGPMFARAEIWIGRYEGVRDKAKAMACKDQKLRWVLGQTEESCSSCQKLNGKVKRGSYWYDRGILPRVHGANYLECNGFRCLCQLVLTDEPISKGPLPRLP